MIDNGDIGRPVAAHVRYCLWSPPSDGKGWGHDPEIAGGGPLQNQGSHAIDILNMMFGPIQAVSALCDNVTHSYAVEDMDSMLVKFENGAHGALDIWAGVPNWRGRRLLEVFGSEGVLVAEETMGQLPTGRLWYQKAVDGGGRSRSLRRSTSPPSTPTGPRYGPSRKRLRPAGPTRSLASRGCTYSE